MPKLTKQTVDVAQPDEVQAFTRDSEAKNFGLRVIPAGAKSYLLSCRAPAGQTRRTTIGKHGSPWICETAPARTIGLLRGLESGVDPRLQGRAEGRAGHQGLCGTDRNGPPRGRSGPIPLVNRPE